MAPRISVTWYSDPSVIPSHTASGLWLIEFSKSMAFHFQYQVRKGNAASSLAAHLFFPSLHLHPLLLSSLSPGLFSVGKPVAMSWGHLDVKRHTWQITEVYGQLAKRTWSLPNNHMNDSKSGSFSSKWLTPANSMTANSWETPNKNH